MLFKLKYYTNISVLKSVQFALFHSYLTYSILNGGRANKTTLLALIRLQNKAVRTLEFNKTKTPVLYSKHKILEIPDLFQLLVAKFMYSFHNGGLPNYFDNYFAEIASVHKYQTRLVSPRKYYLHRMKTPLSQFSLKYIGPKMWSNIPQNLKSSSPYSFGKKIKKKSCYLARLPVDLCFICLSHSVTLRWCHYFPPIYLYSYSPRPLHIGMLFPTVFVVAFILILPDVDLMLFITFMTSCETSSIKIWFMLAAVLAENLIQLVFRQPLVIQHVRTRFLTCETWNFLFFIFFHNHIIN